jgi:hypothetical protein
VWSTIRRIDKVHPPLAPHLCASVRTDILLVRAGASSMPQWNTWRDRHLDQLRTDLTEVEFCCGWSAGQRLEPGVLVK